MEATTPMDTSKTVKPGEWTDTKLQQQTRELTGAYDEQQRTFEALRNPYLTDEARQEAIEAHTAAAAAYNKAHAGLAKK